MEISGRGLFEGTSPVFTRGGTKKYCETPRAEMSGKLLSTFGIRV